jgi:RNA polymerase-binding transcription factor DksA
MVVANEERAMTLLDEQMRRDRIAQSMRPYKFDPHRRCCDCGEPIGIERQKLLPLTGRCACCAAAAEKAYSRMPFA